MWPPHDWSNEKTIFAIVLLVFSLIVIVADSYSFWSWCFTWRYNGQCNIKASLAKFRRFSLWDSQLDDVNLSRKTEVDAWIESAQHRLAVQFNCYIANLFCIFFVPFALFVGLDPITILFWLIGYVLLAFLRHHPKYMNFLVRAFMHCLAMALVACWIIAQDELIVILLPMNLVVCLRGLFSLSLTTPKIAIMTNAALSSIIIYKVYAAYRVQDWVPEDSPLYIHLQDETRQNGLCAYYHNGIFHFVKFAGNEIVTLFGLLVVLWGFDKRMRWEAYIFVEMQSLHKAREEQVEQDTMIGLMAAVFDVVGHLEWLPHSQGTHGQEQLHFVNEPNKALDSLFKKSMSGLALESALGEFADPLEAAHIRERSRLLEYIQTEIVSPDTAQSRVTRKIGLTCRRGDKVSFEAELLIRQGARGRPIFGIIAASDVEMDLALEDREEKAIHLPLTKPRRNGKDSESSASGVLPSFTPCISVEATGPSVAKILVTEHAPLDKGIEHAPLDKGIESTTNLDSKLELPENQRLQKWSCTTSKQAKLEGLTEAMSAYPSEKSDAVSFEAPSSTSVAIQNAKQRDKPNDSAKLMRSDTRKSSDAQGKMGESGCVLALDSFSDEAGEASSCQLRFQHLVDSDKFQGAVGFAIVLNSLLLAFQTDHDVGYMDLVSEEFFFWADVIFTSVFVVEITLRVLGHGQCFFQSKWNLFELALVATGVVDLMVSMLIDNGANLGMIMLLRILRLLKLLRVGRVLHIFKELKMLCDGIVNSLRLLVWSVILLVLLVFATAIFCTREIGIFWMNGDFEDHEKERINELFGSVLASMFTLFQIQTLESWSEGIARPVMRRRPEFAIFFVTYVVLIDICVLNVIVAIIVEKVMKHALLENEIEKIQKLEAQRKSRGSELQALFLKAAGDDQEITKEEWMTTLKLPDVEPVIRSMGLELDAALELFDILDIDNSGSLNLEEFLPVLLRGLHEVRHVDLLGIQLDIWRNAKMWMDHMRGLHIAIQNLNTNLCSEIKSFIHKHGKFLSWPGSRLLQASPYLLEDQLDSSGSIRDERSTRSTHSTRLTSSPPSPLAHPALSCYPSQKNGASPMGDPQVATGNRCYSTSPAIQRAAHRVQEMSRNCSKQTNTDGTVSPDQRQVNRGMTRTLTRSESKIETEGSAGYWEWLEDLQAMTPTDDVAENGPRAILLRVVESDKFQGGIGAIIVLNSLLLASQTDHDCGYMHILSEQFFLFADIIFTTIFSVEIMLRVLAHRLDFFKSKWNVFELVLVALGVVDLLVYLFAESSANLEMLMLLRILRLMKLLRVGRVLHVFRELKMLFNGIIHSLRLMAWSVVLLSLLIFAVAIFCTREIGIFWIRKKFEAEDGETERIKELFGSVLQSMYTLFQIQTLEGWSEAVARPVATRRPELALFFVFYVLFVTTCVLNVIVAIVVENVLKETLVENEIEKQQHLVDQRKARVNDLQTLFFKAAGDDEYITREEWMETFGRPDILPLLSHLGLPVEVATELFDVLDTDASGSLQIEEFMPVLVRGLCEVRHVDLLGVQVDIWRNSRIMEAHLGRLQAQLSEIPVMVEQSILSHAVQSGLKTDRL